MTDFKYWMDVKDRMKVLSESELPVGKSVFYPAYNGSGSLMVPCTIAGPRTGYDSYPLLFDREILQEIRRYKVLIGTHECDGQTPDGNGYYVSSKHIYGWRIYDDGLDNWE